MRLRPPGGTNALAGIAAGFLAGFNAMLNQLPAPLRAAVTGAAAGLSLPSPTAILGAAAAGIGATEARLAAELAALKSEPASKRAATAPLEGTPESYSIGGQMVAANLSAKVTGFDPNALLRAAGFGGGAAGPEAAIVRGLDRLEGKLAELIVADFQTRQTIKEAAAVFTA